MTAPPATLARTHEVFNQSTPWADGSAAPVIGT